MWVNPWADIPIPFHYPQKPKKDSKRGLASTISASRCAPSLTHCQSPKNGQIWPSVPQNLVKGQNFSNQRCEYDHEYIFSIMKHEKDYELLNLHEVLVDTPWVRFELKYRRDHKTLVLTWNNILYLGRSFSLWLLDIHVPKFEIPDVFFLDLHSFYVGLGPLLSSSIPFLPLSPFLGSFWVPP